MVCRVFGVVSDYSGDWELRSGRRQLGECGKEIAVDSALCGEGTVCLRGGRWMEVEDVGCRSGGRRG